MNYPKEQLKELYKSIPKDLQEALFSNKVGNNIARACARNRITDKKKITEVSKHIAYVFLGLIRPNEFQEILEKEIKIKKESAKKIYREINGFVFLPLKKSLEALYNIKISEKKPIKKTNQKKKTISVKKSRTNKKDEYREPME